ncbi:MAG: hypothetical protein KF819_16365 [Labilithrix sp.]|nr:hypothetical protein [Labilithrix sp.]
MTTQIPCTRCSAPTRPGKLQNVGNYGNSPFTWAPDGEPPFPMAGAANPRKAIVAYRCDNCGRLELFAP